MKSFPTSVTCVSLFPLGRIMSRGRVAFVAVIPSVTHIR